MVAMDVGLDQVMDMAGMVDLATGVEVMAGMVDLATGVEVMDMVVMETEEAVEDCCVLD